jgi:hypothetical protein
MEVVISTWDGIGFTGGQQVDKSKRGLKKSSSREHAAFRPDA